MAKFALNIKLGASDSGAVINLADYQVVADLKLLDSGSRDEVKLNKLFMGMKRLKLEPNELAMDMLIIACSMYGADTRIDRLKTADDSWTRQIDLFIPVSDVVKWEEQIPLLKKIFGFLTGDIWNITFRTRTGMSGIAPKTKLKKFGMPYQTDTVCLFSGGMDSFIGAINLLSKGLQPLFLGHAKSSDVSPNQKFCEDALKAAFPTAVFNRLYAFVRIPKKDLFGQEEKTERGRSFLFLTLGSICASALNPGSPSKLIIPENGLISLNLPLTPMRTGSHSTRTTHPHYLEMMQSLLDNLRLGVQLKNPYQFKTKGEMLRECADSALVEKTSTMSCSHPSGRFQSLGNGHCGTCVPCIIRLASFKAAGKTEVKNYRTDIFDRAQLDTPTKKDNIVAFKYMIEKSNQNPEYIKGLIRTTGPLGKNVDDYVAIYKRGLAEVENLLNSIVL
jgi:7-cyano-7-deazaguanine synthase in queuosine biosynthesis